MRRTAVATFATTEPDSDPALLRVIVESRAQLGQSLLTREGRFDLLAAISVLAVAIAIPALVDVDRGFDPALAAALVVAYALTSRVEFRVGSGVAVPTQLVFVPMLFLLPTPAVPLCVIIAGLVSRIPEYVSGEVHISRAAVRTAEAWYAVAPVLVLVAADATSPEWADWPIYLIALTAQFAFDFALSIVPERSRLDIRVRTLWEEFRAVWFVDLALSPVGLLAAFATLGNEWAFVLVLPLVGLIQVFANEREARIESALTLSAAYRGTAHLLGELLSTTHEYTGAHSRSVVVLAHQVGEAMGLDERTLREVEFGALLHDVGKMSVPNAIINKPAALSAEEWELMKKHTLAGEQMLERIGGVLGEVGTIVRSHHERFDGDGYPDGLAGEEIPIAARVITACDSFSAMTTDRPYRSAMSVADAIGELRAESGSQFDPAVVSALVAVVAEWETPGPSPTGALVSVR